MTAGKVYFSSLLIIGLGSAVIVRGTKDKTDFYTHTGRITYLADHYQDLPNRNRGKYRYLQVEGYAFPFEIFVGKEAGDFAPNLERIDQLHIGDRVTVYFGEIENTAEEGINRLAQYLDKENKPYFIRGRWDLKIGGFLVAVGIITLLIVVFLLKKAGRLA